MINAFTPALACITGLGVTHWQSFTQECNWMTEQKQLCRRAIIGKVTAGPCSSKTKTKRPNYCTLKISCLHIRIGHKWNTRSYAKCTNEKVHNSQARVIGQLKLQLSPIPIVKTTSNSFGKVCSRLGWLHLTWPSADFDRAETQFQWCLHPSLRCDRCGRHHPAVPENCTQLAPTCAYQAVPSAPAKHTSPSNSAATRMCVSHGTNNALDHRRHTT